MKVIDPGHHYRLNILDERAGAAPVRYLTFVKRQGSNYPGNDTSYPGTIIQDVVRCCIDRLKYVDNQIPHWANDVAIRLLRTVIWVLEVRAAERHGKGFLGSKGNIEDEPVSSENGHLTTWQES